MKKCADNETNHRHNRGVSLTSNKEKEVIPARHQSLGMQRAFLPLDDVLRSDYRATDDQ
jgi:hypothetical protein